MKKVYETPSVEKVEFKYRDQVVATSGIFVTKCGAGNSHDFEGCTKYVYDNVADRVET